MIVYIFTIIISVFFAYALEHVSISGKPVSTWVKVLLVSLPSILVAGLRYNVGTDYKMYQFAFENPDFVNVVKNFEIINRMFFKVINHFGGSFYSAVFVAAAIFFIIVYAQLVKDSPMLWLSTFLMFGMLFFFIYMNATRQMIAISILMFSLRFLEKNKYLPFIICILFATGIHRSSIIFIIVLILNRLNIKFKVIFWVTPIVFILSNLAGPIIARLATGLLYSFYLESSDISMRSLIGLLWQLLITIMACYVYNVYKDEKDQNRYRLFFNVQILSLWSYAFLGFIRLNEMARLQYIFKFPCVLFIPMIIQRISNKYLRIITIVVVVLYGILNIYYLIAVNNEQNTLPYQTFFLQS